MILKYEGTKHWGSEGWIFEGNVTGINVLSSDHVEFLGDIYRKGILENDCEAKFLNEVKPYEWTFFREKYLKYQKDFYGADSVVDLVGISYEKNVAIQVRKILVTVNQLAQGIKKTIYLMPSLNKVFLLNDSGDTIEKL